MRKRLVAFLVAAALFAPAVWAAPSRFTVAVVGGTFRVLPGGLPAAGYVALRNFTNAPVTLTGATSPGCAALMIHKSSKEGGMSRMESVPSLAIGAGQEVRFETGGLHLMCMTPSAAMLTAKTVNVTLQFDGHRSATASFHLTDARGTPR